MIGFRLEFKIYWFKNLIKDLSEFKLNLTEWLNLSKVFKPEIKRNYNKITKISTLHVQWLS